MMSNVTAIKRNDIQWLRAVAATEVVVWHTDLITKYFSSSHIHESFYKPFGGVGVELFFILSGYVICMQMPTYKSGGQFMLGRIFRLLPMYWIFTTLVIVAYFINPSWRLGTFEFNTLFFIKSYLLLPQQKDPILGLGWTLEHEMIFYAIVAVAMMAMSHLDRQGKLAVAYLLAGLGFLGFALGTGLSKQLWDYQLLSPYMLAFGFGWLMRILDEHGGIQKNGDALALFLLATLAALTVANMIDVVLLYRLSIAGAVFLIFCQSRVLFESNTRINRLMGRIGDASYSLYLSHWFVLSIGGKLLARINPPASLDLMIRLASVVVCTAVAYWLFVILEKPIDRHLRGSVREKVTVRTVEQPARL